MGKRCSIVSISGEKPIHWRLLYLLPSTFRKMRFNLRREANPLATPKNIQRTSSLLLFQSQARSQSTGDKGHTRNKENAERGFNLRREANPLATSLASTSISTSIRFNLRRE